MDEGMEGRVLLDEGAIGALMRAFDICADIDRAGGETGEWSPTVLVAAINLAASWGDGDPSHASVSDIANVLEAVGAAVQMVGYFDDEAINIPAASALLRECSVTRDGLRLAYGVADEDED